MKNAKMLIATGGTGGHLFPAQQLALQLQKKGYNVAFAGKKGKFFYEETFDFYAIKSGVVQKKNPWFFFQISYGVMQSFYILKKYRPNVVIGFGSFHSFPMLFAAKILKIPIILYEPNTVCGKVNRFFSKKARALATQFPNVTKHYSKNLVLTSFLPWKEIKRWEKREVQKHFSLQENRFTIAIFGGSQGAMFLNQIFLKVAFMLKEAKKDIQIIHLTGNDSLNHQIQKHYESLKIPCCVYTFLADVSFALQGVDLAICRAGAASIGDLIQTKTPAILIPYPYATEQHQRENAKYLDKILKGAIMVLQKDLTERRLFVIIDELMQNEMAKIHNMRENLLKYLSEEKKKRLTMLTIIEKYAI